MDCLLAEALAAHDHRARPSVPYLDSQVQIARGPVPSRNAFPPQAELRARADAGRDSDKDLFGVPLTRKTNALAAPFPRFSGRDRKILRHIFAAATGSKRQTGKPAQAANRIPDPAQQTGAGPTGNRGRLGTAVPWVAVAEQPIELRPPTPKWTTEEKHPSDHGTASTEKHVADESIAGLESHALELAR